MKWFRKTFLWASAGCLGATASASAQQSNWKPLEVEPAAVRPAGTSVTLGRPTPLGVVNAFATMNGAAPTGVQKASFVVRGTRPAQDDEPKSLFLPGDLPTLDEPRDPGSFLPITQPVQAVQPAPKDKVQIIDIDEDGKVVRKKLSSPDTITPALPEDRVVILENGGRLMDDHGRSLFGLDWRADPRLYARGEFLLWTARGFHLPPLVTTASPLDPEATRGALGFGSTQLLFGDSNTAGGFRPGARFTLGYNIDPCGLCAIEASFFFLTKQNDGASFNSNTTPVIGRPFFNINTGMQDRELTTSPGTLPGDVFNGVGALRVSTSSSLFGAEVNNRWLLWCGCDFQLTGLVGLRYLNLSDQLSITENVTSLRDIPGNPGNPPISRAGDQILVFDRFDTHNQFFGAQVGLNAEWNRGPWFLDTGFKLAIGATHQAVDIDGGQRITSLDGRVQNFRGGLYALSSNLGHHTQTRFGFVPEANFKLGYNLTDNIRVFVGYDFLYWSSVLRPGDQIDQSLNANIIPNSGAPFPATNQARPVVPFRTTGFWATGMNAGIEIRY